MQDQGVAPTDAPAAESERERGTALHYLEGRAARTAPAAEGAWTTLFGALAFAGGHGVFVLTAVTRLQRIPSRPELGAGPLELAVLAWFVAATPLALLVAFQRRRILALSPRCAWALALAALLPTLGAFVIYLRAVALA